MGDKVIDSRNGIHEIEFWSYLNTNWRHFYTNNTLRAGLSMRSDLQWSIPTDDNDIVLNW